MTASTRPSHLTTTGRMIRRAITTNVAGISILRRGGHPIPVLIRVLPSFLSTMYALFPLWVLS